MHVCRQVRLNQTRSTLALRRRQGKIALRLRSPAKAGQKMDEDGEDERQGLVAKGPGLQETSSKPGLYALGGNGLADERSSASLQALDDGAGALLQQVSSQQLLARVDTRPTESRLLAGLRDLGMCCLLFIPYALMKLVRILMGRLGVSEHRWKGVPNDVPLLPAGRQRVLEVAAMLRSGLLNKQVLLMPRAALPLAASSDSPISAFAAGGVSTPGGAAAAEAAKALGEAAVAILGHLHDVVSALEDVVEQQGIPFDDTARATVYARFANALQRLAGASAVNPQDVLKELRHEGKAALKKLCTAVQGLRRAEVTKAFIFQCLMRGSLAVPASQQRPLLTLEDGRQVVEVVSLIPLDPGLEFLRSQNTGGAWEEHIAFMSEFPRMRPSDAKKEWVVQAMAINARLHTLALRHPDGRMQELATVPRSGAFAVHGRKPKGTGLAGLVAAQRRLEAVGGPLTQEGRAVLAALRYASAEALEPEVAHRTACCVAQALPVIVASLRVACRSRACLEAAARAGSFLHVQQSLLSDLNTSEHSYLQDTQGALDILREVLSIRFEHRPLALLRFEPAASSSPLGPNGALGIPGSNGSVRGSGMLGGAGASSSSLAQGLAKTSYGVAGSAASLGRVSGALANGTPNGSAHRGGLQGGEALGLGGSAGGAGGGGGVSGPRLVLTLDREWVPEGLLPEGSGPGSREEVLARTYRFQPVLFSQGVNVLQSLGFFKAGDSAEILQDTVNRESLERLNAFAAAAGRTGGGALIALNAHYSRGARRGAKDVEAIRLVRAAAAEVGGVRALNCKSGKDRTALELAQALSAEACAGGHVPARLQDTLKQALLTGLSYSMTGENNGQPSAYAFSELELACLPPGWRPPWQLCGKVMS